MTTMSRDELHKLIDKLDEDQLDHAGSLLLDVMTGFDSLSSEEEAEVEMGKREVARGEWDWYEDVKRNDV